MKYFGGAIYISDPYLDISNISNSSFVNNKSYAGGVFYFNDFNNETIKNILNVENNIKNKKNNNFIDNIAESHGYDFASKPYIILFKNNNNISNSITMQRGNFPYSGLIFNITDIFNQTIIDNSKYYSNINLIIKDEGSKYSDLNEIKFEGNICNFYKGFFFFL